MAVLPRHSLIGFLADEFGKSYYKDSNGNIALDSLPHRLRHLPDGFIDFTLKFSRNSRYLGVDRTFVDELRFVKDALDIVRHIQYTCRGSQSKIYFLLYELNLITGVYDLYDKLLVDLSQWDNDDTGVKTKLIQAGPSYYIKANENVVYEIPFGDEQVVNDGILLDDTFNYGIYQQDSVVPNSLTYAQTIGIAFLNNEGDNVGLIHGSQSPVEVDSDNTSSAVTTTYDKIKQVATSPVESITPLNLTEINIHLEGIATGAQVMTFSLYTKNQIQQLSKIQIGPYPFVYPVQPNMQVNTPTPFVVNWIGTASLDYDDNAFIAVTIGATTTRYPVFTLSETKSYIKLQSRNPTYVHPAIRPLDLFQKLIDNVTGNRYKVRSQLLEDNSDDYWTSGDAIRGIANAKIKPSLVGNLFDFYFPAGAALGVDESDINNPIVWLEDATYTFDNSTEIINIGEVSNFHDIINNDRLFSSFSVGQEDKTYEERAGKNEVISENIFTTPVTTQQKVLDLKRKTRTDAYGITFLGADFFNKPTTDSSSDNECFVINVVDDKNFSAATISIGNDGTMVFITQLPANILLGARFQLQNTNNGNNGIFTVKSVSGNIVTVNEATIAEAAGNAMIYFYAKLINRNYNPVSGVPPTYFNLKYTPMRTLLASQGYWAGGLLQLQNEYVIFTSSKKNAAVTSGFVTENANIPISTLVSYWRNIDFTFDTKIPQNIVSLLRGKRGYITFTVNGYPLQGFVDDVTIKPALNPSQSWKLICSSLVNPADLEFIRNAPFYKISGGMYSKRNPFHIVKANDSYPAQYHFKNMDADWHQNRVERFADKRRYFQPWQLDDTTEIQMVTQQSAVAVTIMDCRGNIVDTVTMTQKIDPFINAPYTLFEGLVNFLNCKHGGVYCMQYVIGTGSTAVTYFSEPFVTAREWKNTLLLSYTNSTNKPDMVFSTGFTPNLRVYGGIYDTAGKFRNSTFEDEPADFLLLDGVAHDEYSIEFTEVPDWMESLLNRICAECDTVTYDGNLLTMSSDSFERNKVNPNSPLTSLSCTMRPANNYPAIDLDGGGQNSGGLLVTYGIKTRAFTALDAPNADQTDNIVQITEVN